MSAESSAKAQSGSMIGIAVISRQTSMFSIQAAGFDRWVTLLASDSGLSPVRNIHSIPLSIRISSNSCTVASALPLSSILLFAIPVPTSSLTPLPPLQQETRRLQRVSKDQARFFTSAQVRPSPSLLLEPALSQGTSARLARIRSSVS